MAWDFSTEPEFEAKLDWMRDVRPRGDHAARDAGRALAHAGGPGRRSRRSPRPLKEEVKRQGLWAAHLPPDMGGGGFGQVKLGLMHEILGAVRRTRPSIFGNNAPDSRQRRADRRRRHRRAEASSGCSRCSTASCAAASR